MNDEGRLTKDEKRKIASLGSVFSIRQNALIFGGSGFQPRNIVDLSPKSLNRGWKPLPQ
jgi:hypothetical protein